MSGNTTATDQAARRERAIATLADLLSSRNRAILLAWATPRLDTPFSLTELSRAVDIPVSSAQHECYKLERLGVLQGKREGTSRRYRVIPTHPLTRPLLGLTIAALGLETVLHDAVAETGEIEGAVIAGPAREAARPRLTLVIVGRLSLEGLVRAQERVALVLGRAVDDLDLAYVQDTDWTATHGLVAELDGRPLQSVYGPWPPPFHPHPGEHSAA